MEKVQNQNPNPKRLRSPLNLSNQSSYILIQPITFLFNISPLNPNTTLVSKHCQAYPMKNTDDFALLESHESHHHVDGSSIQNWAIALSSIATALFLFPFITAVAFGYPGWILLTSTSAGMVSCAALQIVLFLVTLFLVHKIARYPQAHHHWGCVHLLPGIDAILSICMVGALAEFIVFFASGCFKCPDNTRGGCCYTPIGPVLPAAIVGLVLGIAATVFISRILPAHHHHGHQLVNHSSSDASQVAISQYGALE